MRPRKFLHLTVFVLLCQPLAFIVTIMLFPLWRWVEEYLGIEALGHSGPAEWCYWLVDGSLVTAGIVSYLIWIQRRHR